MNILKNKTVLLISTIIALLLVFFVVFMMISTQKDSKFQLISIHPNEKSSTLTQVVFEFNSELDPKSIDEFAIEPIVKGETKVDGNKLVFTPVDNLAINQTYTARLEKAIKKDSIETIGPFERIFETEYRSYNMMTETEKQLARSRTNPEDQNSSLKQLPKQTIDYSITYYYTDSDTSRVNPIFEVKTLASYSRSRPVESFYSETITNRQKALDYLQSIGVDINKSTIVYVPKIPSDTQGE